MTATATEAPTAGRQVAFFTSSNFGPAHKKGHWYAKDDGTRAYRMEKVPIFRSGEFRDSMGEQHLFDRIHMEMLANNFGLLHSGAFPDPPVRCNHPGLFSGGGLDEVIGYVDNLTTLDHTSPVNGETYTYLLADFDVLDEEAAKKIDSTLWRHRSAEIGFYETNDGMEFWPTLVGFAYVDIPAVEGLNGFSKFANALPGVGKTFVAVAGDKEEGLVADDNKDGQQGQSNHSAGTAPAAPPAVPAAPAAPAPHVFKIGGKDSTDFAAVQAHITQLETRNGELEQFERETREAARASFVASLVTGNKILASQKKGVEDLVATMTDEQFGMYRASFDAAPSLPTLGQHATQADSFGSEAGEGEPQDPEVEQARRIYNRHQTMGLPAEQLAATPSAKILRAKGIIQ